MLKEKKNNVCTCGSGENDSCDCGCIDVTVNVDVHKIVRNVAIAGVLIVGIIFGCNTVRKMKKL